MKILNKNLFKIIFGLCSLLTLWVLWSVKYLPMVDLHQHAAQISIIKNISNPAFGFQEQFFIDRFIPYVFPYYFALFFNYFVDILSALKIVLTLAILGVPLSMWFFMKQTGGDIWWSLLGFPLAFSYSFYWGFFSYVVAVPVAILLIAMAFSYGRLPSPSKGVTTALLAVFLFFNHALALVIALFISGCVILTYSTSLNQLFKKLLPFLTPIPFILIWMNIGHHDVPRVDSGMGMGIWGWERITEFSRILIDNANYVWAHLTAWLIVFSIVIGSHVREIRLARLSPLAGAVGVYFLTPFYAMEIHHIYQRYGIFVILMLSATLIPTEIKILKKISRFSCALIAIVWLGILSVRFGGFDHEARDIDPIFDAMKSNKAVLALPYNGGSYFSHSNVFDHFPTLYQAQKGGKYSFSFAFSYKSVARYKPGKEPLAASKINLPHPTDFHWDDHGHFDYYVVRSFTDLKPLLFRENPEAIELVLKSGPWWLYENKSRTISS